MNTLSVTDRRRAHNPRRYDSRVDCPFCGAEGRAYWYGDILRTWCCAPNLVRRRKRQRTVEHMAPEKEALLATRLDVDGSPVGHYLATRLKGAMGGADRREHLHMRDENSKAACLDYLAARTAEGWLFEVDEPGPNLPTRIGGACLRYRIIRAPRGLMKWAVQVLKRAREAARKALRQVRGDTQPTVQGCPVQVHSFKLPNGKPQTASGSARASRDAYRDEPSFTAGHEPWRLPKVHRETWAEAGERSFNEWVQAGRDWAQRNGFTSGSVENMPVHDVTTDLHRPFTRRRVIPGAA